MASDSVRIGALVLACCLCPPASWAANSAEEAFQKSQQLVAAGDLLAAKKALTTAVKTERGNQAYRKQYMLVSQALKLEKAVKTQQDPQRWESSAKSLSLFYTSQGLHAQSLPVDEAIFQRLRTEEAAMQLADTLLSLDQNERAVEVLRSIQPKQATTASQALLSVALARQGNLSEASRMEAAFKVAPDTDSVALFLVARAQAAIGEDAKSLTTLARCYESVMPSRLDALKSYTRQCREFSGMASSVAFAQALQTKSKVHESKCSGGSSCSNCPMRGKCSHGK